MLPSAQVGALRLSHVRHMARALPKLFLCWWGPQGRPPTRGVGPQWANQGTTRAMSWKWPRHGHGAFADKLWKSQFQVVQQSRGRLYAKSLLKYHLLNTSRRRCRLSPKGDLRWSRPCRCGFQWSRLLRRLCMQLLNTRRPLCKSLFPGTCRDPRCPVPSGADCPEGH